MVGPIARFLSQNKPVTRRPRRKFGMKYYADLIPNGKGSIQIRTGKDMALFVHSHHVYAKFAKVFHPRRTKGE